MDYKDIIRSRSLRIRILQTLNFIPDDIMVKLQYYIKTGNKLNLNNPRRFTEKLQWYKLYYRDNLMSKCADKWLVREYVNECGKGDILNECYGVYDSPEDINFDKLPKRFVIKDTLGDGGNSVIICTDKQELNIKETKEKLQNWIQPTKRKHPGREWVYETGNHRIIIERYIDSDPQKGGLIDYKFFCFNGKVSFIYGIADRQVGVKAGLGIFDSNFSLLPCHRADENPLNRVLLKPNNFKELINISEVLAAPFPHARIDLYNQNEKVIFGEITFFDGSGYMKFNPDRYDYVLGENFKLPFPNNK